MDGYAPLAFAAIGILLVYVALRLPSWINADKLDREDRDLDGGGDAYMDF